VLEQRRAERIRLLGLDVDGVLTDNAIFLGEVDGRRVEFKRFDIQDGLGHRLLAGSGIEVIWVSGRHSVATSLRGAELRVGRVLQVPPATKVTAIQEVLDAGGLNWDQLAFVGDDFADLPVLERAGLAIAVANARPEVKAVAHYVTSVPGGHGAVREVIDLLLKARGTWDDAMARYLAGSGVAAT
jgi:3-deoxy-D-manno-octulosonate 8-phosphate phosphatase (KDO 8-P phosphatase)